MIEKAHRIEDEIRSSQVSPSRGRLARWRFVLGSNLLKMVEFLQDKQRTKHKIRCKISKVLFVSH